MIRQVVPNRKERETIARATPSRVRDKKAGVGTNFEEIILAVNRRIRKGFNFDQSWVILDSEAQTSLFHNAKLLKNLCEKTHNKHIVGISDEVIEITHEGHFCENLRVDWHPDVPVNVVSFSQAANLGWGMTYDETTRDFIARTHAGQKLVFSLCEGLYICDMTSQVYRNLRARCDDGVELFVGSYKNTENWKLQARLDNIHTHFRSLVAAAAAYPEMGQRDDYQEAMDWLRKDGGKLEAAIEYRRKELYDQTGSGVTHEENPVVAKSNPHGDYLRDLTKIGIKRYEPDNQGLFSSNEEGDE
jgi:hypothetical protein